MMISDLSVRRPVLATVFSLLIIVFGAIALTTLPLRELPDVDQPIVSVDVSYRGASAQVMETQVTRVIEDQLSGIEGIDLITAQSRDGRASINVEFKLSRDLEDAANDVRNAVSRASGQLPPDIEPPVVSKTEADADPIIWYNLQSTTMDRVQLSDYAERIVVDRFSTVDGVANVRVGGSQRPALRIWLDPNALAARGLTVDDVESALRSQNIELPAGYVEGATRDYSLRIPRPFQTPEEFARLPIGRGALGAAVRLGDVARVELAPEDTRRLFRGNGVNQVGLGVVRQSKSNALTVAKGVKAAAEDIRQSLPPGTELVVNFDSTVFIDESIKQVWHTLLEAVLLVVLVIFLFLGSWRAAAVPTAVIPVCLVGAFAVLALFGFSINLLTLMALVLSIGIVVDDSIIVLENVQRRIDTLGEPPAVAAERGTRQVAFAVIATSAVLVAVFAPLLFNDGYVGRLFIELAATVSGVIIISAVVALTLTPMMCSKLLKPAGEGTRLSRWIDARMTAVRASYRQSLDWAIDAKWALAALFSVVTLLGAFVFTRLPGELTPAEDRGAIFIMMSAPEGAGFEYSSRVIGEAEKVLLPYVENGEAARVLVVLPGFGDQGTNRFNSGFARMTLVHWDDRERSGFEILDEINAKVGQIPGAVFRGVMQNPFTARGGESISIVLAGAEYEPLAAVADRVIARAQRENPQLVRPRMNYEPTAPRAIVEIDRERAAALGVSVQAVGRALEATMGVRRVTRITDRGEEYDVLIQAERDARSDIVDLTNRYVRSDRTSELVPLSTLVSFRTVGEPAERRRVNRLAAVTVSSGLAGGYSLGEALAWLETAAREEIGDDAIQIDYTGATKQFKDSSGAILFAFLLALVFVFLVLAAQFESFISPVVIMVTVPLGVVGGLIGLYFLGASLNIYSQVGLIILIGLAAKNGILIVEFANQLRDEGKSAREAILESSELRFRPIIMTSVATILGALPLVLSSGAGAESRKAIGIVIVVGMALTTALTLLIVPAFYDFMSRFTRARGDVAREIDAYEAEGAASRHGPAE
jgi:multidrug efflux pump